MRFMAEAENARRRAAEDVESAKKFALQSFAKDLLDIADNMSLALNSVAKEVDSTEVHPGLKSLYEGIVMTDRVFHKAMEKHGIKKMDSLGKKFDANSHQVMFQFEDPSKPAGTVGQVFKEGYTLHGRIVRPAAVGTVKASPQPSS